MGHRMGDFPAMGIRCGDVGEDNAVSEQWIIPEWLWPALVDEDGKEYLFFVPCTGERFDYIAGLVSEDI